MGAAETMQPPGVAAMVARGPPLSIPFHQNASVAPVAEMVNRAGAVDPQAMTPASKKAKMLLCRPPTTYAPYVRQPATALNFFPPGVSPGKGCPRNVRRG